MILTVDPVSIIPAFGMRLSAWLSVHLIASDYTTSGCDPEYATFTYNFPEETTGGEREEYVRAIGEECDELGVTIAGGHTGSYPGAGFTVIGSGTMLGFGDEGGYVAPSMAQAGDVVLMTKHAAIEATVSLATSFPEFVERRIGSRLARKARSGVRLCSTVADARAARGAGLGRGGVSSMHDATEGGVLGALGEMAAASRKRFVVNPLRIPVAPEGRAVCKAFGLDPLLTMGEGALLITCGHSAAPDLIRSLARTGVGAAEIGTVREGSGLLAEWDDGRRARVPFGPDRYWDAYARASGRHLR
jgi:hydrogenase maturation factor